MLASITETICITLHDQDVVVKSHHEAWHTFFILTCLLTPSHNTKLWHHSKLPALPASIGESANAPLLSNMTRLMCVMRPVSASVKALLLNSHTDEWHTSCLSGILANAAESTKKGIHSFIFFTYRLNLKPIFPILPLFSLLICWKIKNSHWLKWPPMFCIPPLPPPPSFFKTFLRTLNYYYFVFILWARMLCWFGRMRFRL